MKGRCIKVKLMEEVYNILPTNQFMKVIGSMVKCMDSELTYIHQVKNTKVNGKKENKMARVFIHMQIKMFIMENG